MSVIPFAMPEKNTKQKTEVNQEKNTDNEITDMYTDMVLSKILLTENKVSELFDLLHKLVINPYRLKDTDRLLQFSVKFRDKIEIPHYLSNIVFEDNVRITGIEIKGGVLYFTYEVNNIDSYRYYIDFSATKLILKEYVLVRYILSNLSDEDLTSILNVLSDIIAEIDSEKNYILRILRSDNVKMDN